MLDNALYDGVKLLILAIAIPAAYAAWQYLRWQPLQWTVLFVFIAIGVLALGLIAIGSLRNKNHRLMQPGSQSSEIDLNELNASLVPNIEADKKREKHRRDVLLCIVDYYKKNSYDGLKALRVCKADELESNDELLKLCDDLVKYDHPHPLFEIKRHVPQEEWLNFLKEARLRGMDLGDKSELSRYFIKRHPAYKQLLGNAFEISAIASPNLQNLTERGFDIEGKPPWSLDCDISIHNLNPTQSIDDVRLRILSVTPPMVASPAHYPRTQNTTIRRVQFYFTDIPLDKPLLGDQTGRVRIFNAARRVKFSEGITDVRVQFYGAWPDNLKAEFVPQAEHLLTVEVTGSGVRKEEAHFHISFSTHSENPVFAITRISDIPDFAIRKRRAIYKMVAANLAKIHPIQFGGLKCLQDARADTLESNDDLVWVCDNLVRDGYEHPFYYFDEYIPKDHWLVFVTEARKSGIDFGDDMATLQWFMETHASPKLLSQAPNTERFPPPPT